MTKKRPWPKLLSLCLVEGVILMHQDLQKDQPMDSTGFLKKKENADPSVAQVSVQWERQEKGNQHQ